ncbi:MAG: AhpC/TSA family protein [Flavobacteriales bacterium]|nr:AhpC/TSA family protein [Flavobacteriales bacterium]
MKNILLFLSSLLLIISCKNEPNKDKNQFQLSGTLENIPNAKMVYLVEFDNDNYNLTTLDSAEIKDNKFKFLGTKVEPETAIFRIDSIGLFKTILEKGKISLNVKREDSNNSLVAKAFGTPTIDEINAFTDEIKPIIDSAQKLYLQFKTNPNPKEREQIQTKIDSINTQITDFTNNYIKQNTNSFWSLMLLKERFAYNESVDEVNSLFNSLDEKLKKSNLGLEIQKEIDTKKQTSVNATAPEFSAQNSNGELESLHNSLGEKVTILDFWASWCGPCRMENKNLVAIFKKYKDKGLNIVSVSLDQDTEKWKNAILQDKLTWTNLSISNPQSEVIKKYQINAIPLTIILDKNGTITSKNLRGEELEKKVAEMIAD